MVTRAFHLGIFILVFGSTTHAAIHWTAGGNNRLWDNPDNWEGKRVPSASDEVYIDVPPAAAPNGPILQDGIMAKIVGLGCEVAGEPTMTMTGGTLEITDWIWWGDGANCFGVELPIKTDTLKSLIESTIGRTVGEVELMDWDDVSKRLIKIYDEATQDRRDEAEHH